ncbi:hypothetical protein Mal15_10210 [Stieleria maiorica]|uniref:Uncharacterized protein n=1 Tax=Stieleria maiorica TaxID=2795974 RepID=A0A5B9M763_9BACT|nr:hypothetical protein Mal15_10210 [Stieleria maiorica]
MGAKQWERNASGKRERAARAWDSVQREEGKTMGAKQWEGNASGKRQRAACAWGSVQREGGRMIRGRMMGEKCQRETSRPVDLIRSHVGSAVSRKRTGLQYQENALSPVGSRQTAD